MCKATQAPSAHPIDRGVLWEGERVSGFGPVVTWIGETLENTCAYDGTIDSDFGLRLLDRRGLVTTGFI